MFYRKKPVVIEAIKWTGKNLTEIYEFAKDHIGPIERRLDYKLKLKTLNGFVEVEKNEWIAKGVRGEFYPIADDIFEESYEKVEA